MTWGGGGDAFDLRETVSSGCLCGCEASKGIGTFWVSRAALGALLIWGALGHLRV